MWQKCINSLPKRESCCHTIMHSWSLITAKKNQYADTTYLSFNKHDRITYYITAKCALTSSKSQKCWWQFLQNKFYDSVVNAVHGSVVRDSFSTLVKLLQSSATLSSHSFPSRDVIVFPFPTWSNAIKLWEPSSSTKLVSHQTYFF